MSLAPGQSAAKQEVVVVTQGTAPAAGALGVPAAPPPAVADIIAAARGIGLPLRPMFPETSLPPSAPNNIAASAAASPELQQIEAEQSRYLVLHAASQQEAQEAADRLKNLSGIETAYVKPAVENPLAPPVSPPAVGTIPDFSAIQGYLDVSPGGVGARRAWLEAGGRGSGVRVIDIEGGWTLEHVDLRGNTGGLLGGQPFADPGWTEHGTAVLGVIRGDDNGFGVTGIAPDANFSVVSHQGLGSAGAIAYAADRLAAGDIMLLEMHRPGPRFGYLDRNDQLGYIAVEWWPDDFLAIRRAILRGIIVVEAAGNGSQNLDDPFYDRPHPQFPTSWRNPFRGVVDSGAILVGAGAPPTGQFGPDRSRLDFSNHGSRVDCQGWGRGVVTTGYGDLYGGTDEGHRTVAYTAQFSGTSSASPVIAGTLACLQGLARAGGTWLDAARLRGLLRETGAPQTAGLSGGTEQRIGNRPDLGALIARVQAGG